LKVAHFESAPKWPILKCPSTLIRKNGQLEGNYFLNVHLKPAT
jgi:hypothetical protein